VTLRVVWPALRLRSREEALSLLLMLHTFRFLGLSFLVPGVVAADLPAAFAQSAAYGDVVAALLAVLSLLVRPRGAGVALVWIFNLWGTADIFNAFYQANSTGLSPGQLGAAYFIPTVVVPALLLTHMLMFYLLARPQREASPLAVAR
jgi:hypothetical protein